MLTRQEITVSLRLVNMSDVTRAILSMYTFAVLQYCGVEVGFGSYRNMLHEGGLHSDVYTAARPPFRMLWLMILEAKFMV